jgi:hypothetical protein
VRDDDPFGADRVVDGSHRPTWFAGRCLERGLRRHRNANSRHVTETQRDPTDTTGRRDHQECCSGLDAARRCPNSKRDAW